MPGGAQACRTRREWARLELFEYEICVADFLVDRLAQTSRILLSLMEIRR